MIIDKCKNCKHYEPDERKCKEFFSSKPKTVYGENNYYITVKSDARLTINLYSKSKETKSNGWCEKYERKAEEKNNEYCVYNYTCPNCNEILSEVEDCNYCPECGTRLDWSKKNEENNNED